MSCMTVTYQKVLSGASTLQEATRTYVSQLGPTTGVVLFLACWRRAPVTGGHQWQKINPAASC